MAGSLGQLNILLGLNSVQFNKGLEKSIVKARNFATETNKSFKSIENSLSILERSAKWTNTWLSTQQLTAGIRQLTQYADAYTEIQNRMKLVSNEAAKSTQAMQSVFDISMRTRQSVNATAQVYQRFAQNAQLLGISQEQVISLTETVSKSVALSGTSAASAEAALTQFGQALASGVFRGDEFNSVMEQTPGLALAIANGLGVTIYQLRDLASKGKLTVDVLIPALEKVKNQVDNDFNSMSVTTGQALTNLSTAATKWIGELNTSVEGTDKLAKGILYLADNFDVLAKSLLAVSAGVIALKTLPNIQSKIKTQADKYQQIQQEKQLAQVTRERAIALREQTAEVLKQATAEYQAMKTRVDNIRLAQQQTIVERELLATKLQGMSGSARVASLVQYNALLEQEKILTKQLCIAEKELVTAKSTLKVAYAENAITQAAANAGLVRSSVLMNAYRGVVRGVTAELQMMKAAFLSNPLMLGITALTVVASFAGYWFATADATEEATQKAKDYVQSVDASKAALEKMSAAALQKQLKDLEESKAAFNKKIEEQKKKAAELQKQLEELSKGEMLNYGADSLYSFASNAEKVKKVQGELIDLNADLDQSMRDLDATNERYNATREHYNQLLGIGANKTPDVTDKTFLFSKSLDELGISAEDAKNKLQSLFSMFAGQGILAFQQGDKIVGYANDKLQEDLNKLAADKVRAGLKGKALYNHDAEQEALRKGYQGEAKDKFIEAYVGAQLAKENNRKSGRSKKSKIDYVKQYTDQLTQMQQRLAELKANASDIALYGEPSQYQEVNRLTQDIAANAEKYKHFGAEGLTKLKAMAEQIDKAQQAVNIAQFAYNNEQKLTAMEFELELLGKTRQEQELLRYGNQLDIETARLKIGMSEENIAKLDEEIAKLKERYAIIQAEKEKAKEDPIQGIKNGWETIEADVTDIAKNMENVTVNAFNGMSNALTDMVMTGKANFGDLAKSIIKDIVQMTIRMAMFKAISSAFGGFSGGGEVTAPSLHWKGGLVGFDTGGFTGLGGKYTPAGIVHKGEYVITKEATSRIGLDYLNYLNYGAAFAGRRGFANGGGMAVPKVPMVGQRANNGTQNITVKVINQGEPVQAEVSTKQKGDQLEITLELMKTIARNEANQVIQTNFRAGGAFS
ncbi:tape measure protein [Avibacterium paragallinarum]|uniref:Phage-related minor tail protein n=1 Tax=Avibacterium paragallinarum TaxID=728 RepID=A0A380X2W8_AVIPA|nr:tape measure protein [Avibacterium paragallinarum]SUU97074.1 Phage-related minor tail protein [Avibacterium paragallinarum]